MDKIFEAICYTISKMALIRDMIVHKMFFLIVGIYAVNCVLEIGLYLLQTFADIITTFDPKKINIWLAISSLVRTTKNVSRWFSHLVIVRSAIVWFTNINPYVQPFHTISKLTDRFLRVCGNIIPIKRGLDLGPVFAGYCMSVFKWIIKDIIIYIDNGPR